MTVDGSWLEDDAEGVTQQWIWVGDDAKPDREWLRIAACPSTPSATLVRLARCKWAGLRHAALANPRMPLRTLRSIARTGDSSDLNAILRTPRGAADPTLVDIALDRLESHVWDNKPGVWALVGRLVLDAEWVISAVTRRGDHYYHPFEVAVESLTARDDAARTALSAYAVCPYAWLREAAMKNPQTPPEARVSAALLR